MIWHWQRGLWTIELVWFWGLLLGFSLFAGGIGVNVGPFTIVVWRKEDPRRKQREWQVESATSALRRWKASEYWDGGEPGYLANLFPADVLEEARRRAKVPYL